MASSSSSTEKPSESEDLKAVVDKWLYGIYAIRTQKFYESKRTTPEILGSIEEFSQAYCSVPTFDVDFLSEEPYDFRSMILLNNPEAYISFRQYIIDPRVRIFCRKLEDMITIPNLLVGLSGSNTRPEALKNLRMKQKAMEELKPLFTAMSVGEQQDCFNRLALYLCEHRNIQYRRELTGALGSFKQPIDHFDMTSSLLKCNCMIVVAERIPLVVFYPPQEAINCHSLINLLQHPKYANSKEIVLSMEIQRQLLGYHHLFSLPSLGQHITSQFKSYIDACGSDSSSSVKKAKKTLTYEELVQDRLRKLINSEPEMWKFEEAKFQKTLQLIPVLTKDFILNYSNMFFVRNSTLLSEVLTEVRLKHECV